MSETVLPSGSVLSDKAIASAWTVWARMRLLVISAMVASAFVAVGFAYLKSGLGVSSEDAFPRGALLEFIQILTQSAIAAPLAVATHRLILKGESTPGIIALRKPYHWIFFAWLCGFGFVPLLLMDMSDSTGSRVLGLVPAAAGIIVWINSVLLFPAVAIEAPSASWLDRFMTSWKQMRGHYWLFVKAAIMAIFPLLVMAFLLGAMFWIAELVHIIPNQAWEPLLHGTISMLKPVSIILWAAVASWLYLYVNEKPAA
jgi:hypothetical protein